MKKILFLLLVTISSYAQTYQNPTFGTVTTKTNTESATANRISVQETDGKINWLQPVNIPIPYIPTGYTPITATLGGHLTGINNQLESIVATTAGVTTRVWFTADQTTIGAGTFDLTNQVNKGTAASHIQSVTNDDNQKKYYTTDLISIAFPTAVLSPPGIYAGNLSASTTPNSAQQRWTVEIYKCNNAGTPIASGITGAPVGDLGVTVIAILDSGLLTLADGSVTNVQVSGNLASPLSMAVGERLRYHVSAEKVGTAASNITQSVYYGTSYNSYYDVPVPLNTTAVLNLSTVTGATTTDALNNLKTLNDSKLNKTYTSNYDVADSNTTISGTTFDAFGILVQSLSNKIFQIYREGAGHISTDGKIVMRTSTDGGKTFSARSIIYQDVVGIDCRNIAGGVTPSGRIVVFFLKFNGTVPTYYSQGTIYSDDDGVTWSNYVIQTVPSGSSGYSPYGNMIAIADGKLALPYYIEKLDGTQATYLKFSIDNGATWGNDVLVASDLTNGYNEASYAYLDGGVILCVSRRVDTLLLSQLISTDNGQTWTNQGLIPSANSSNVAPWLNTYIEANGEKYVALFTSLRGIPYGVNGVVGKKSDLIAGVSGWLAETRQVLATSVNSDSGYPSVINPRGGKKMLGMSYASNSIVNPLSAIANYTFWNYTPSAVVPAMNATTNYLVKKTGNASLIDSRVIDDGTTLVVGSKINASGLAYRAHYPNYSNIFQFRNLNLQELSTSSSEESTLSFNSFYDNTNNNRYLFNGGATLMYFGKNFFQIAKASTGTAGGVLTGITAPFQIMYNTGNVLINGATDDAINAFQVSGNIRISGLAGTGDALLQTDNIGKVSRGAVLPLKYVALISQTGTSAPTVTVLENTIGSIVWTRSATGNYEGTLTGAFTASKTASIIGGDYSNPGTFLRITRTSANVITIFSANNSLALTDGLLNGSTMVEIRVYP